MKSFLSSLGFALPFFVGSVFVIAVGVRLAKKQSGRLSALFRRFLQPAPRYKERLLMTGNELEFFHRIRRAALDGHVFPQVAMAGLIGPDGQRGKAYQTAFRRISQKRVDFAVFDASMTLLAVIELDDRTHNAAKDTERDAMFLSAGIRTLRYESKAKPTVAKIQTDLVNVFIEKKVKPD